MTLPVAPLHWSEVAARFDSAPYWWMATGSARGGPHSVPVWGVVVDGGLFTYAEPGAVRVRDLSADARVTVHLESGQDVWIVRGRARDAGTPAAWPAVCAAYRAKYREPGDARWLPDVPEMAAVRILAVEPERALSWQVAEILTSQRRWRPTPAS